MLNNKTIAVVVPAYNEEKQIGSVLDSIPDYVDKIILVDDGSQDRTSEIGRDKGAYVVSHSINKGVGSAFQTGVKKAIEQDYDIMVNIDADGQFNPDDIIKLVEPILNKSADFVTASRFKDKSLIPVMPKTKLLGNKFMSWFISKLTKQKFFDVSCGFRAYSKDTLLKLNLFGEFTYTQETFIDLAFKKATIKEIPVKVRGSREFGKSRVASNLYKYAFQTLKIILRTFRDYKPFRLFGFFSLILFMVGFGFGLFLFIHYVQTGEFSPYKWTGFTSGFFLMLSLSFLLIGFILDMFARMRVNQEEIMYHLRQKK